MSRLIGVEVSAADAARIMALLDNVCQAMTIAIAASSEAARGSELPRRLVQIRRKVEIVQNDLRGLAL